MNKEQIQQYIVEYFQKLPKEAQEVFSSMSWIKSLEDIHIKYGLSENEIESLGTETTLLLLGIIHREEFRENIKNEIKKGDNISDQIIKEINTNIIGSIQNQLLETFQTNKQIMEKDYSEVSSLDPRFESMPDKVKEAINLSNWKNNLYKISSDNKLNVEQMGILEDITVRTMKNEISPDKYKEEISLKMNIDKDKTENIARDVNTKIFQEIRNIMRENENTEKSSSIPQETIQGTIENFEEAVPMPPYAKKEIHDTSSNNVVESAPSIAPKKEMVQDEMESELHNTLTDQLKSVSLGTPGSSDFSIPKVDISKQTVPITPSSAPAKPHDPYREII